MKKRRIYFLAAVFMMAGASLSGARTVWAYGPGYEWDYGTNQGVQSRGSGGPGVPEGSSQGSAYAVNSGPVLGGGNARTVSDNTVRAYPGFNTNVPDPSTHQTDPGIWYDDWDDDWDEEDWWYDTGGPGVDAGQGWRYSPGGWWFQLYGGGWFLDGWQLIRDRWYRFDQNGYMVTGWFQDGDGNWYYLNPVDDGTLGMMRTGWQVIDGKNYYFNPQSDGTMGRMYADTVTPDGYKVGPDGAMVP